MIHWYDKVFWFIGVWFVISMVSASLWVLIFGRLHEELEDEFERLTGKKGEQ